MAFRLVSSGGAVVEPAMVNLAASGTIIPGSMVDFNRTSGVPITPTVTTSTGTMIFGVALDYAQGASDTFVRVIPIDPSQLWEVDCANAATTAQTGIRHAISASTVNRGGVIHNTATDIPGNLGIFLALMMTGATTGSGKLIGKILSKSNIEPYSGGL